MDRWTKYLHTAAHPGIRRVNLAACALLTLCLATAQASPAAAGLPAFRAGVRNSEILPLSPKQLKTLLAGLQRWTGYAEIHFDDEGFLRLGERTNVLGGSATARELLASAVDGRDCFVLEDHHRSPEVAFAATISTEVYVDEALNRHEVWSVKLDLFDYIELRGNRQAIALFDPAIAVLHELGHGVLGLSDSPGMPDPVGECERHMNRIRRELNLPERETYRPENKWVETAQGKARRLFAELRFSSSVDGRKTQKLYLEFDAENVGITARRGLHADHRPVSAAAK